jgi:hypothetical protein
MLATAYYPTPAFDPACAALTTTSLDTPHGLPPKAELRAEYDAAIRQIACERPMLINDYYAQTGDIVFDASWQALQGVIAAEQADVPSSPRLQVISAPAGGGKTSFSIAMLAAVVRSTEGTEQPMGGLFLTDQITRADENYRDLSKLLPGQVAVWSKDHDKDTKPHAKTGKIANPAALFSVDELDQYPVVIVTHEFFKGKRGHKAREYQGHSRALIFVDERPNETDNICVQTSQAEQALEYVQTDEANRETVAPHLFKLIAFMRSRTKHSSHSSDLEKPSDARKAWTAASDDLWWFRTAAAERYAEQNESAVSSIVPVFAFARSLAEGCAFLTRSHGGKGVTYFIGYRSDLLLEHGMVLLDATADIDRMQQICPWRILQPTPRARYDNLNIVHVPSFTRENLSKFFRTLKNREAYVASMRAVILEHMSPGQRALVVCRQPLFLNGHMPDAPEGKLGGLGGKLRLRDTEEANTKEAVEDEDAPYVLDIDGRLIAFTWYGKGIGSNAWKNADVVLLFGEFFKPRRISIADAQAIQGHKATEGDLATMTTQNCRAPAVDALQEGNVLRWIKQMCVRGRARCFDEHGVCGKQKLVYVGDQKRLLANANTLFPGARVTLAKAANGSKQSRAEALLSLLSNPDLPDKVSANWVGQQLKRPWREMADVMRQASTKASLQSLGWRYVPKRGRGGRNGGSWFKRIASRTTTA